MLEYVPETVYRVARHFTKAKLIIPIIYVKVGGQAGGLLEHRAMAYGFLPLPSWFWRLMFPTLCSVACKWVWLSLGEDQGQRGGKGTVPQWTNVIGAGVAEKT